MKRKSILTVTLAAAALTAAASPASAQTFGGITLSFGSGYYTGPDYDADVYSTSDGYDDPRYYDRDERGYDWQAYQRREQLERWRAEQQRRRYWDHERREHQRWHDDDD